MECIEKHHIFFKILLITMRKNTKNAAIPCNDDIIACLIVTAIIKIYFITIPKDHSFFDIKIFFGSFCFSRIFIFLGGHLFLVCHYSLSLSLLHFCAGCLFVFNLLFDDFLICKCWKRSASQ